MPLSLEPQPLFAKLGFLKPYISKTDAYRSYGETNVDRWIKEGLVTPRKDGKVMRLNGELTESKMKQLQKQVIDQVTEQLRNPDFNPLTH